ncbi:hypothetical protein Tco_0670992 [Tanacetum coccineum]
MSAMANTTSIVTTVTKTATKEKTPKEKDAAPRVNILDFCEEHYKEILPVIMDKIRRDKRKEVHTRLDFGDNTKKSQRMREGSQNSSVMTLSARYCNPSGRLKARDHLEDNDGNQKKYIKDPVEIHNIKQKDGETIEDFIERFKAETGRMKGAPECMRISGFMHGVNNPELTKRLNEHIPKTMEEIMTVTTAFIRGQTAAASKKKGHAPWKPRDQSKRHASEWKSDF